MIDACPLERGSAARLFGRELQGYEVGWLHAWKRRRVLLSAASRRFAPGDTLAVTNPTGHCLILVHLDSPSPGADEILRIRIRIAQNLNCSQQAKTSPFFCSPSSHGNRSLPHKRARLLQEKTRL